MTNEDPDETIKALCAIPRAQFTWNDYKQSYESLFNEEKSISRQHADAHFYILRQFHLIEEVGRGTSTFKITSLGKEFCHLLSDEKLEDRYQRALSLLILSNHEKGYLFKKLIELLSRSMKKEEIKPHFKGETYRTLIAWAHRANLITCHRDICAAKPRTSSKYTPEEIWKEILNTYKEMQKVDVSTIRRYYVPFGELRLRVASKLGLCDPLEFDRYFSDLLEISEYKQRIRFHGAPTIAYEKMETVSYKGKRFPFLSIVI